MLKECPPLKEKKKPSPFYYACITLPDHQRLNLYDEERKTKSTAMKDF